MDLMTIRRGLLAQMAGAKVKTGTFLGNDDNNITLDIGFKPDVVVIDSGLPYNEVNYAGMLHVVIARGIMIIQTCHQSATSTSALMYGNSITSEQDEFGYKETPVDFTVYATFADGQLTVRNNTSRGNVRTRFINNQQYTWTAYKK